MILFAKKDTGYIIGSCWADRPEMADTLTRIPDGCDPYYFDDATHPELENYSAYKIVSGYPIALTQAELDQIAAEAPVHEPNADEKIAALEAENQTLKENKHVSDSALNQLSGLVNDMLDQLMVKSVL